MLTTLMKFEQNHKYKSMIQIYVERIIEETYESLWEDIEQRGETANGEVVPTIEELFEYIWTEVHTEVKIDLIDEAIQRKDYEEIYGYTLEEFTELAFQEQIPDEALIPDVDAEKVVLAIHDFLINHRFFYKDYHHELKNTPVVEVW